MSKFLQTSIVVQDRGIEVIVQPFVDRILVLITQMGKIGNLIQASIPPTLDLHVETSCHGPELLPCPPLAIQLTSIFGSAPSVHMQTLHSLYATHAATLIWLAIGGEPCRIVVGIGLERSKSDGEGELSKEERETFHTVMQGLRSILECTRG